MAARPDVGTLGIRSGEAKRVANFAGGDFIVADQAGEDGESGGVGGSPGRRTQRIGDQVEDGAAVRLPTGRLGKRAAEFVQDATDVGEGIKVASFKDPFGNVIGIIENPNFKA